MENTENKKVTKEDVKSEATNKEERVMEIIAANAAIGHNLYAYINSCSMLDREFVDALSGGDQLESIKRMVWLQEIHPLTEAINLLEGGEFNAPQ